MFKSVGDLRGRNDFAIKENNKSSIVKQQNFNKIMLSNGISLYEVPYEASFVLDYSQIRNLSFYVFPIADIESARGYGSVTRKVSVGPITSEIVYVEGNKTKIVLLSRHKKESIGQDQFTITSKSILLKVFIQAGWQGQSCI